uniref:Extracellular solute-binding protein family 1 n=2 Tax=Gloeothece TaxID=28070 RepID=E0UCE7_GLOV7|nr:extracellular solute-binding protein family 1 [Gloeothece verrucosa PCC 7822]
MKKISRFLILFLLGTLIILGCQSKPNTSTNNVSDSAVLNIYNWADYIAPEVLQQFEQEFKAKINYDTYDSSDALYAKLKAGNPGYDLVFPQDVYVKIMAKEGLLEEISPQNITNIKHLDKQLIDQDFDPKNQYSIPYVWGALGLGYNGEKTGEKIDSWQQIFSRKYQGQVAVNDDPRAMLGVILIYLGYSPNTTNPQEIEQAKNFLLEHKANIAAFAADNGENLLEQGEVTIIVEWNGDILKRVQENPKLRYAFPKEGSLISIDNLCIPKDAPHKELAEKFINFMSAPEMAAKNANFVHYATSNQTALDQGLINQKDRHNPGIYPPAEIRKKLTFLQNVGQATALYDQAWTEIKAQ